MTGTLPVALLLFVGIVALLSLVAIMPRSTSPPRLVVAGRVVMLAMIAAVWAGWALRWRVEQYR